MNNSEGIVNISKYKYIDINNDNNVHYNKLIGSLIKDRLTSESTLKSNICNTGKDAKARYFIPSQNIPLFMTNLEKCRNDKLILNFMELQLSDETNNIGSGLMYDFDILLDDDKDILTKLNYNDLILKIYEIISNTIDLQSPLIKEHYIMVIKKDKMIYNEELKKYKTGIHIIMPTIQVTKNVKKYIFKKIIESQNIQYIFDKIGLNSVKEILDSNSVSVPVYFTGNCKPNAIPYSIYKIFSLDLNPNNTFSSPISIDEKDYETTFSNIIHEFSLNYSKERSIVQKSYYKPKNEIYSDITHELNNSEIFDLELENAKNDINLKSIYVPNMNYYKNILSLLSVERLTEYSTWRNVIFALSNGGEDMKSLAIWVSKRVPHKWDYNAFNKLWIQGSNNYSENKIPLSAIISWAKHDNKELYDKYSMKNICDIIRTDIKNPILLGDLQHSQYADYLKHLFKNKFTVDIVDGKRIWFEFISDSDKYVQGELYKWKMLDEKPDSLFNYLSDKLTIVIKDILVELQFQIDNGDEVWQDYLTILKKGLKTSAKKLYTNCFKAGVIKDAESKFIENGFNKSLDTDDNIFGVGNGLLEFNKGKTQLISTYHSYPISMYSPINYIEYDENNEHVKLVYNTLLTLFPEDERDVFEFLMFYLSTALDDYLKESLVFILTGCGCNGKTFLLNFIASIFGEQYARQVDIGYLTEIRNKSSGADPQAMEYKKLRWARYSESSKHEKLNSSKLKEVAGQEIISKRQLHSRQENFRVNCVHTVATNHGLTIEDTDHGIWRRIITVSFKIVFKDKLEGNDPNERLKNPKFIEEFIKNPKNKEAMLSILVYYRTRLYEEYDGNILQVPKPTIDKETRLYRNSQDIFNKFIDERTYDSPGYKMRIDELCTMYRQWHKYAMGTDISITNDIIKGNYLNSKIGKYFKEEINGTITLHGLHIMVGSEQPTEKESLKFPFIK